MDITSIDVIKITATILALIVATVGHEIMHGKVAHSYGDSTAFNAGRLSINPIKHLDIVGSIILPLILIVLSSPFVFGWAKPVPIHIKTILRNGGYGGAIFVSLAGVIFNIFTAILASTILATMQEPNNLSDAFVYYFLFQLVVINVVLAVFNMWPLPKFDGGNFLVYFSLMLGTDKILNLYMKLAPFTLVILLIILFTPLQEILFSPAFWIWEKLLLQQ